MRYWGLVLLCLIGLSGAAQNGAPDIPSHFELVTPEDYKEHQALARKCMIWLIQTPLDEFPDQRVELNAFAMLWLSGHPEHILEIESKAIPGLKEHNDLFPVFAYGMVLYSMQPTGDNDNITLHTEGLRAIHKVIMNTKRLKRQRIFKELKRAARKEKLRQLAIEYLIE